MQGAQDMQEEPLEQQVTRLEAVREEVKEVIKEVYNLSARSENLTAESLNLTIIIRTKLTQLKKFKRNVEAFAAEDDTDPSDQNSTSKSKKPKTELGKFDKKRKSKNPFVAEIDQIIMYVEQIIKNLEGTNEIDQIIVNKLMLTHIGEVIKAEAQQKLLQAANKLGVNMDEPSQFKPEVNRNLIDPDEFEMFKQFVLQVLIPYYNDSKTHPFLCHKCFCIYYTNKLQETRHGFYSYSGRERDKKNWKKLMTALGDLFRADDKGLCFTTQQQFLEFIQDNILCADSLINQADLAMFFSFKTGRMEVGQKLGDVHAIKWPLVKIPAVRGAGGQVARHDCTNDATRRAESDIKKLMEETRRFANIFNPIGADDAKPKPPRRATFKKVALSSDADNSDELSKNQPPGDSEDGQPGQNPPKHQISTLGGMFSSNEPVGPSAYQEHFQAAPGEQQGTSQPTADQLGKRSAQPEGSEMPDSYFEAPDEDSDLDFQPTQGIRYGLDSKGEIGPIDFDLSTGLLGLPGQSQSAPNTAVPKSMLWSVSPLINASVKVLINFNKHAGMPARWLEVETPMIKEMLFLLPELDYKRLTKQIAKEELTLTEIIERDPKERKKQKPQMKFGAKSLAPKKRTGKPSNPETAAPKDSTKILNELEGRK